MQHHVTEECQWLDKCLPHDFLEHNGSFLILKYVLFCNTTLMHKFLQNAKKMAEIFYFL